MPEQTPLTQTLRRLAPALILTRAGLLAERLTQAFWPLWCVVITVAALLILGVQDEAAVELVWGAGVVALLAALVFLVRGALRFRFPRAAEAEARFDASIKGRPLQALRDAQAIGGQDAASAALWAAHQQRMARATEGAPAVRPDLRLSTRDPFGLRYIALMGLVTALLFGSIWRVGSVAEMTPGGGAALASGPSWEGWLEPPSYTGLPVLYLNDIQPGQITAISGSRVTLRLYGAPGELSVSEAVSGRPVGEAPQQGAALSQDFTIVQDGQIAIEGAGGRAWKVVTIPDLPPRVSPTKLAEASGRGELTMPFHAEDDYGVVEGMATIALDMGSMDRRYGLEIEPEQREAIALPLPLPISGNRADFEETLIEDFSKHPWANLPVVVRLEVIDAAGQHGLSEVQAMRLAARTFFDPLAAAVIEQRRDLLWNRDNARRIVQVMRALSWQPDGLFDDETTYLRYRHILRRLDGLSQYTRMTDEQRDEIAEAMWSLALLLEEGDIGDAMERMQRAQEQLSEAMKRGASEQEIARLMQELRDATQDYLRQLSRQAQEQGEDGQSPQMSENSMQMTQGDLQEMMDRIQELMEQGRMAEAQQALQELQQLMENMRVTQGQGGQGQQSPGQQAMDGLAETLRDQQGLSDQAFRDLQRRFNPGQQGQQGQQQGQNNDGLPQGPGQMPGQMPGEGQGEGQGEQPGEQQAQPGPGQQGEQPGGGDPRESLAERQRALRDEVNRQRGNLPGAGTEAGDAAREALERAEGAMDGAEEALRRDDLAEAIDRQSEAMEALREGMRNLGEAVAEQERQRRGEQGQAQGNAGGEQSDPLGRNAGSNGSLGNQEEMLQGEDVYRRARDLLDEIRRRSGEGERPQEELDYLRRLLDRF